MRHQGAEITLGFISLSLYLTQWGGIRCSHGGLYSLPRIQILMISTCATTITVHQSLQICIYLYSRLFLWLILIWFNSAVSLSCSNEQWLTQWSVTKEVCLDLDKLSSPYDARKERDKSSHIVTPVISCELILQHVAPLCSTPLSLSSRTGKNAGKWSFYYTGRFHWFW